MRSEASQLEASLKEGNCQLSTSQMAFIAAKGECDQSCALVDAEAQIHQDL